MSTLELTSPQERWGLSSSKMYGWLVGVAFSIFGGLMCAVPVGAILGGLVSVTIGVFLCLTFSVSMSATSVRVGVTIPLVVIALALLVIGRAVAPIEQVVESIQTTMTLNQKPRFTGVLGIPAMLIGVHILQIAVPWVRSREPLGFPRSALGMILIQSAILTLLIGSALTRRRPSDWHAQPYWLWLAVPAAFCLGVGLRRRWQRYSWIAIAVLTGITLPLTWQVLTHWDF